MITKRDKRNIIIASVVVTIILILTVVVTLYFTTDMFKSNQMLFGKYLAKATISVEGLFKDDKGKQYDNLLENNRYNNSTQITANYTKGIGTTGENTSNVINSLKLIIDGKTDKLNKINYKNFILEKDDARIAELEYLKSDGKYGIRFVDLFDKYLAVENQDLKSIASKIGIDSKNIPDHIEEVDLKKIFTFSDEEIESINKDYISLISDKYDKDKFTKAKKSEVTINDQSIMTNAYTLTLTKEQLNEDIYVKVLEQIKQDDRFLSRIEQIDDFLNPEVVPTEENIEDVEETQETEGNTTEPQANTTENEVAENEVAESETTKQNNSETQENEEAQEDEETNQEEKKSVKDTIIEKIDSMITEIRNKNIGDDVAKITVYESEKETVRTTIETQGYKINIDTINKEGETYINIFKEVYGVEENSDEIVIEKREDNFYLNRQRNIGEEVKKTHLGMERVIENGKEEINTKFGYDIGKNKIEIEAVTNNEVVNYFDEIDEFLARNNVLLNDLSDEEFNELRDILNDKVIEQNQKVSEQISAQELFTILNELDILPDEITIDNIVTLTKSEVSKFNAQFEIYKGEEVEVKAIDNLLNIVKDHLETVEVLSDSAIKLNIVRGTVNEELAAKVSEIVNNTYNKSKKYSIKYEYDEETQLIKSITIEILSKN